MFQAHEGGVSYNQGDAPATFSPTSQTQQFTMSVRNRLNRSLLTALVIAMTTCMAYASPGVRYQADDQPPPANEAGTAPALADPTASTDEVVVTEEDGLSAEDAAEQDDLTTTLGTLRALSSLQRDLMADMEALHQQISEAQTTVEKQDLVEQLEQLEADLQSTSQNLQELAAGADIDSLRATGEPEFDFQEELLSLLQPALKEMKEMSSHVREKSEQRDKIAYYDARLPTTERAVANIQRYLEIAADPALKKTLQEMLEAWQKQLTFMQSERQSAELQLRKLESSEVSLAEASQSYLRSFFDKRGRYLGQAILVVLLILVVSRLSYRLMVRWLPGYRMERRPLRIRVLDLSHRIVTALLMIFGPMVVFYVEEDWLLFSLGILILLGVALTLRHALPRFWKQIQLFLNVGSVREGERIEIGGMPWLVNQINFYTMLENPTANLHKRVSIDDLVDLRSRPVRHDEPWFPCKMGNWVLFPDGSRGKVIGLSPELTQIVMRGGALRTFATSEFIGLAPVNLSTNFRIKESIGVSYDLQAQSVSTMLTQLRDHVHERLRDEGYSEQTLNLSVEFEKANTSSLDLMVIADFSGDLAEIYNRMRRSIQRWSVEACTKYGWEIPFTQVTIHKPA